LTAAFCAIAAVPLVILAQSQNAEQAEPALTRDNGKTYFMCPNYAPDFRNLFQDDAPWQAVISRLDVFKTYIGKMNDRQWYTYGPIMMSFLARHHIGLCIEAGGLRAFSGCDGAEHARRELLKLVKVYEVGGTIDYIVMDGPFRNSIAGFPNPKGLDLTIEEAAAEIVEYMQSIHAAYPDIKIGMNEPIPWYRWESYPEHLGRSAPDLKECIDALLAACAAAGEQLWFFHADSPYEYSNNPPAGFDGWAKLVAIQDYVQQQGLWFGLYHNSSDGGNNSDKIFFERTLLGLDELMAAGGDPDHFIVQSWYPHPSACMPENPDPLPQDEGDIYPFTYLMKQFMMASGAAFPLRLRINNVIGETVAGVDVAGNMFIAGSLAESSEPPVTESSDLIIKDGDGNIVAAMDSTGNLVLAGFVHGGQPSLTPPAASLVIENRADEALAYFTSIGDLYLIGQLVSGP